MVLVIDNYDSFTYNLVQYLGELKKEKQIEVFRNDKITLAEIEELKPDHIIISPGPGRPENAGISCQLIDRFMAEVPILGVCLGHQCIGQTLGAEIIRAAEIYHGKTSLIFLENKHQPDLFADLPDPFTATRYHSLIIDPLTMPDCLQVTARTSQEQIMAVAHRKYPLFGVQFHPESILTDHGKKILDNFLKIKVEKRGVFNV